jgi:hypothetical protein
LEYSDFSATRIGKSGSVSFHWLPMYPDNYFVGATDGNRTHVGSLGSLKQNSEKRLNWWHLTGHGRLSIGKKLEVNFESPPA